MKRIRKETREMYELMCKQVAVLEKKAIASDLQSLHCLLTFQLGKIAMEISMANQPEELHKLRVQRELAKASLRTIELRINQRYLRDMKKAGSK